MKKSEWIYKFTNQICTIYPTWRVNKVGDDLQTKLQTKLNELKSKIDGLNEPEKSILTSIVEILESIIRRYTIYSDSETTEKISIFEFIKQKKLETHVDKVVGMAYYLYKYKNIDPFNVKDIEKMYEEARISLPKNLSDIIAKLAKNKGYFIECNEKKDGLKAWKISASGIEYIESLPKE